MTPVIGKSAMDMKADRPESLLSNLVADVLRQAASNYIGKPADMAVTNWEAYVVHLAKEILPLAMCIRYYL
jgi:hypothetical protein